MPTFPFHVLIVGGGLGGLCLAQGLKNAGIEVSVYERDAAARFHGQGYRISIQQDGTHALRDCLPENLFELCVATAIKPALRMAFLDHRLNLAFSRPLPHAEDEPDRSAFGMHRLTLREILLTGLDENVHYRHPFERYEQLPDGRVTAHFSNRRTATGDLLVGADGSDSAVRRQLLPDAQLDDLHHIMYGCTPIRPDTLSWLPEILLDTFNNIRGPHEVGVSVATCRTREPFAEATARLAPSARLTEIPDYLSWTVSITEEFRDADASTLHGLARDLLRDWHPAIRRIIAEADIPATFPVTIRSARPVAGWATPNVTLLGNAIHTMSPGRGTGAGVALHDAELLRTALADAAATGEPIARAKARYEQEMLRYGFEAVAASRDQPFLRRPVHD